MTKNLLIAAGLAGCALAGGLLLSPGGPKVVHAQTLPRTCDVTSLSANYGYLLNGVVYDSQGYPYYLGAGGRLIPDGSGNLSGADTFSLDGTVSKRQYTGTYAVNADCTGSMTWNTPSPLGATHFDFVIVNNGKTVNIVQTDSAFILTGKADLQTQ